MTRADVERYGQRLKKSSDEIAAAVCGSLTKAEQRLLGQLLRKVDSCQEDVLSILEDMRQLSSTFQEELAIIDSVPGFDEESVMEIIAEISAEPPEFFRLRKSLFLGRCRAPQ